MSDQKQYIGRGKEFGNFGNIKIGLKVSDLKPNEKGYINFVVGKKREVDKYGNTHNVWIDDWSPQNSDNIVKETPPPPIDDSEMPF